MATLEEAIKQAKFPNQIIKANLNVLYTANWLNNKIANYLKPFKVTHEQFNVLRILKEKHPESMCQKDVLSRMLAPNSNVTLIIKKLITKKFVTVEQSQMDKREYKINCLYRPDKDRILKKDAWEKSAYAFVPYQTNFGELCGFADDVVNAGKGFGMHPH